jgi:hypothetical protein
MTKPSVMLVGLQALSQLSHVLRLFILCFKAWILALRNKGGKEGEVEEPESSGGESDASNISKHL